MRRQTALSQRMLIRNMGAEPVFSEFKVHNPQSNKDYRVVIRGKDPGVNYCSCPDFSINTLGTCKHIETVLNKLQRTKQGRAKLKAVYQPEYPEIYLRYGTKREVIFSAGLGNGNRLKMCTGRFFDIANVLTKYGFLHFDAFIKTARKIDSRIRYYDDAATFIAEWRDADFRRKTISSQYPEHKQEEQKRNVTLPGIKTTLYPYQYKGAVFAAAAGGLGLNLQNASTVINMDLPWNPAVLEQRIGRVHRMGQHKPVQVINFIAEGTIEHGMLSVLAFKKSLFAGVLDGGEDIVNMGESRLNRFTKDVEKVSGSIETATAQTTERPNQGEPIIAVKIPQEKSGGVPVPGDKPSIRVESKSASGVSDINSLYGFLSQGASFLQGLAQSIKDGSGSDSQGTGPLSSLIEHDIQSGRSFLKIPLPEPDVLGKLLTSLTDIIRAGSQR